MQLPYQLGINSTIEGLIRRLIFCDKHDKIEDTRTVLMELFNLLMTTGFDYYELLALYTQLDTIYEKELICFIKWAPVPQEIMRPEIKNIRKVIAHWTPTKYHTAPIDEVVLQIQHKIDRHEPGIYLYNSNLNTRSRKSVNDLYTLIITNGHVYWHDINRKRTFEFSYAGE